MLTARPELELPLACTAAGSRHSSQTLSPILYNPSADRKLGQPRQHSDFSPYVNNGGTTMAVAGKDFCIIGADTRMSLGYSIMTRMKPKLHKLTDRCVLASSGMQADIEALQKMLDARLTWYEHQHRKSMSTPAIAQLLSNTLYYRRFFPYYAFNVLGGIDDRGEGVVYSYDAVGSFEQVKYSSSGTGQTLIQPVLDNQVAKKNQVGMYAVPPSMDIDEALDLVKDAFTSAGERDIYTGDYVTISLITRDGVQSQLFELKFD